MTATDAYNFGLLIYEVFNGSLPLGEPAGQTKGVPQNMQQSYKRLLNPNPKLRLSVGHFLDQGLRKGGFFETPLIGLTEGVENLGLKTESERTKFLRHGLTAFDQLLVMLTHALVNWIAL